MASRFSRISLPLLTTLTAALLAGLPLARASGAEVVPAPAQKTEEGTAVDWTPLFQGVKGTLVLKEASGRVLRHDPARAARRYSPASTFKIPNSLIALETGVATGADFPLPWKPKVAPREPWWPKEWAGPQTLRSALAGSVVWYYQELARRIGPERMQTFLDRFDYGSRALSGEIDQFWLRAGITISANEQVDFLERFYHGRLGVSEKTTQTVKEILLLEETPEYRLSGKTGLGFAEGSQNANLGWLVGYLERGGEVTFFALNADVGWEQRAKRMAIVKAVLAERGLIPGGEK